MVGDNPPKTFLEAFGQALNFEAISQCMGRDKELSEKPIPLVQVQRQIQSQLIIGGNQRRGSRDGPDRDNRGKKTFQPKNKKNLRGKKNRETRSNSNIIIPLHIIDVAGGTL